MRRLTKSRTKRAIALPYHGAQQKICAAASERQWRFVLQFFLPPEMELHYTGILEMNRKPA
jgi:hypothetical protein